MDSATDLDETTVTSFEATPRESPDPDDPKRDDNTPRAELRKRQKEALALKRKSLQDSQARDKAYRDQYLLSLTELFAHFIEDEGGHMAKAKAAGRRKIHGLDDDDEYGAKSPDHSKRHRRTEDEEDAELIAAEREVLGTPRHFETTPPYIRNGEMRDYQIHGLNWIISLHDNGINGILADEMGLGKTLQVISFLGYLKHYRNIVGPHLIVVPKSTLNNWDNEFKRWAPDFNVFLFHGAKNERSTAVQQRLLTLDFEVCITSYEICLIETTHFKKLSWQYIIIDEAHRIKNEHSKLSEVLRLLNSKNRLLITGTPLQNNLHELWSLLNFLLPDVFRSAEQFDRWFDSNQEERDRIVQQLHKVLSPFLLRRVKADVEKSLLPKKELNLYVGMSVMQRRWYQKILEKDLEAVNGALSNREGKTRLLNIVMQLRKCCNHPYLFDGAEPGPPYTTDIHLVENCGKMVYLDKLLSHLKTNGSRVLLFSQMSRLLDILEDYCHFRQYPYCRIDGNTTHEDRIQAIDEYNRPGSEKFIFLLTTRAGGLGINLVTADIVIIYDSDWNPQVDLQAMDRAHRIGQTKQVWVYRFITENTVEEKIIEKAAQKLRLDQLVIQQGRVTQQQKAASKEELLGMVQHGAESMFQSADATIADEAIEKVIERGEQKTRELLAKYSNAGLDDLQRFTTEGVGSSNYWQGEDWTKKRKHGMGIHWIQPAKRERKANYAVDQYYRDAMRPGAKIGGSSKSRGPRLTTVNDFQFYPARFMELQERENYWLLKQKGYQVPLKTAEESNLPEVDRKNAQKQEQEKINNATELTEEEIAEKEELGEQGFEDWNKRDFQAFVRGCEKYGRKQLESISHEIEGKSVEDVKAYAKVFWQRYKELADYEKVIGTIEKGEQKLKRQEEIQERLQEKVSRYKYPLQQLRIHYGQNKVRHWTEEEDRFMLVCLARLGYGTEDVYDRIRWEILKSEEFRFDWFIKSRTSAEISRRCHTLVGLVEKELTGE